MSYYGFLDILIIDCALYNFAIQNFLNIGYIFNCITFYYNYTVILYIIYNYIILNNIIILLYYTVYYIYNYIIINILMYRSLNLNSIPHI